MQKEGPMRGFLHRVRKQRKMAKTSRKGGRSDSTVVLSSAHNDRRGIFKFFNSCSFLSLKRLWQKVWLSRQKMPKTRCSTSPERCVHCFCILVHDKIVYHVVMFLFFWELYSVDVSTLLQIRQDLSEHHRALWVWCPCSQRHSLI